MTCDAEPAQQAGSFCFSVRCMRPAQPMKDETGTTANNITDRRQVVETPFTVSEIARQFGVPPRTISDLFYARRLDDRRCPIVGGRRMIPVEYLPDVESALRTAGWLQEPENSARPDSIGTARRQ
jgi:hypothetical protein